MMYKSAEIQILLSSGGASVSPGCAVVLAKDPLTTSAVWTTALTAVLVTPGSKSLRLVWLVPDPQGYTQAVYWLEGYSLQQSSYDHLQAFYTALGQPDVEVLAQQA